MNIKMRLAIALTFVTVTATATTEDVLSLHLSCNQKEGCVTLEKDDGKVAVVMPDSALVLNADTVKEAYINNDSNLTIQLSDEASVTLGRITTENIGRELAIVFRGRALANPLIRAPIYAGRIEIAVDRPTQPPYWESMPWLFKKIYPDKEAPIDDSTLKRIVRISVSVLPLILVVSWIAFRRIKKRQFENTQT